MIATENLFNRFSETLILHFDICILQFVIVFAQ